MVRMNLIYDHTIPVEGLDIGHVNRIDLDQVEIIGTDKT